MDQFYMATLSISILAISITICLIKTSLQSGPKTPPLPPGPQGLPILGYLPFLSKNMHHQFTDLAHKYGPIFKLYLGTKLCVVISSPSLVKEIVRDQDAIFANRDVPIAAYIFSYGANDIAWSPQNSQWRSMRKVFVQEMLNNKSLEASLGLRRDEIRKVIKDVYSTNLGKPIYFGELPFRTQLNVVVNMLWGGIIEGEEGERIKGDSRAVISKIIDLLGKPNVSDFYPGLAWLDIQGVKKEMESCVESVDRIFDAVIDEYKPKLRGEIKSEGKKDFLQILLELMEKGDSEMSITLTQLKALLMDMVVAGTDTTATTIEWAMAELMNNPEVMAKAQTELSNVVGLDNIIEECHLSELKYLEAIIKETLRLHPAAPLLVPKCPVQSSIVGGYTIPQDSKVFINVSSIQTDPSIWENPMEFKPERFLDDNEKCDLRGNNFNYLPFGSGRRICPGLPLAERMSMYFLASLIHSFEWKLPNGEKLDMSGTFGIVLRKSTPLVATPSPRLSDSKLYM
ncbi:Cytochrome P450 CYP2 subfamily [Handroanthus impetiginosus]|uniref:Flavonoid-6-hydroxylase n=1 Tax=Handroanthus impetiginosus TaxID=429701 RepID=A0A2G9HB54_9LAMI|nr:Cytochrome P450 CYP2 subfamily [Handroanthus impetiginosus]